MIDVELPAGWRNGRLRDCLREPLQTGFASGTNNRSGDGMPHLRPMNVSTNGRVALDNIKFVPYDKVPSEGGLLRPGDVLFNNTNSPELVGKTALYDLSEPRAFSNHMTRVRCNPDMLDARYCAFALHHKWQEGYFEAICNNHVSQASVSRDKLADTVIPLPPVEEQRRIAAKLDDLLGRVAATRERLDRVPAILRRFRQSVLAAAVSGRLGNQNAENMPADWRSASIEELCELIIDCPHATPKWAESGEICLRTTNFLPGRLDLREVRYVSPETYAERVRRGQPRANDVLYSREGGILGIACIFPSGLRACLGQRMMLLRTRPERILPRYLMHVLNSPSISGVVRELTIGSASPHINVGDVRRFNVPLPSLRQQRAIVELIDNLFSLADAAEQRHAAAATGSERTTESILARAFNGGL